MKSYVPFMLLLLLGLHSRAQDSVEVVPKWEYSGYLKDLQWVQFDKNFSELHYTNLIHNRVNLKWMPSEKINGRLEIRNRFYWGDDVKNIPNFKDQLRNQNEAANLSIYWFSNTNAIIHTNVERLWLEYRRDKWNLRAGRQRLNWGMTNNWNPNDIFNTYNFLDFDYEERPGSDAIKFQYLLNDLSSIEVAAAATDSNIIAAAKYLTNIKNYDLQLIAGIYQEAFTAGFGWAGSISDVGFKGEAQFYTRNNDSVTHLNLTMEADYIFKNGWYLSGAILYNHSGIKTTIKDWSAISFQVSPQNLMPSRWNLLIGGSKEFTPLFSASMNLVYSPKVNMLILFPSFNYNVSTNLDLDLVWQSFFVELYNFQAASHIGYLRVKWNF